MKIKITGKSTKYPIGLQVKQGWPFAIRPIPFHKPNHKAFTNISELVKAIYEARKMFELSNMIAPDKWLEHVASRIN